MLDCLTENQCAQRSNNTLFQAPIVEGHEYARGRGLSFLNDYFYMNYSVYSRHNHIIVSSVSRHFFTILLTYYW